MNTLSPTKSYLRHWFCFLAIIGCLSSARLSAATVAIYTNDFESYTAVATNSTDLANANPTGVEWSIVDDLALAPTTAGAGVQVINWLTNRAGLPNKSLLLQPATEADINLRWTRSGSRYQVDFWTYVVRQPTSSQNFLFVLRAEGADNNGDDFLAYRVDRATNSTVMYYYDGVGPGAAAWVATTGRQATNAWQHHRMVINPTALTFDLFLDDMNTPVVAGGDLSRSQVPVPTIIRIVNEGNTADDGWFAIDDLSVTVDDSIDLSNTFTEGFESYTARAAVDDNANPQGPWVTTEMDGTAATSSRAPARVQVVGTDVVTPHSGTKCLKLEGGQRTGVSLAWGVPPQSDVQITWWARVPASATGGEYNYLRMSLYGVEDGNAIAGDCALLGYGVRNATIGRPTSLTYYAGVSWYDTMLDFTADTWEEYRITTHNSQGKYTIVKNPSSASPIVLVDRAPMIGTATNWGPTFMVAWSSSNGSGHPPVYIDDIEVKSLVSNPDPMPPAYKVQVDGGRFTKVTSLDLKVAVGAVAVDPRDNQTIVVAVDASPGYLYQVKKVASGNWQLDPKPLVTGLVNPSGLTIDSNGTIWWVHDGAQSLMRLKAPWSSNSPVQVIKEFGFTAVGTTNIDDDPIDVCIAPANFNGSIGKPGQVLIADRGVDGDANNCIYWVDPTTTLVNQTNYANYVVGPTPSGLGSGNINAMTTLPASGEVATLSADGAITAVDANGNTRQFWPTVYANPSVTIGPLGIATDPTTGRLWIADDYMNQIWSVAPEGPASTDKLEVSFPLNNPAQAYLAITFHDPGLAFSADGKFMVVTDSSVVNGGGWLMILHNEEIVQPLNTFSITGVSRVAQGIRLSWQSAGTAAKYRVQRSTTLGSAGFVDISADLTDTQYTDTDQVAGPAFYRVVAKP